jgi:hypothetical protein
MYSKLFTKVLDSSIWLESHPTRIVWMTMLASMDEDGMCQFASVANLARRAIVTIEEARHAVSILEAPDLDSSDPDNEGRRLERVPGGWIVLNATKYKQIVSGSESRRLARERAQRYRDKKAGITPKRDEPKPVTSTSRDERDAVGQSNGVVTQLEKEKEKDKEIGKTSTLASSPSGLPAERGKLLGILPLTGGREYEVCQDDYDRDRPLYPGIDVRQEYRAMKAWLLANPTNQKTPRGIRKFINNWLSKAQDRAKPQGATHGFTNKDQQRSESNLTVLAKSLADFSDYERAGAHGGTEEGDIRGEHPQNLLEATCR